MDDRDLISRYIRNGDDTAFTQLVQAHLNFVYAAALRQVGGDTHLAEDVAQEVFADLARKASSLVTHPVLKGWLFTSARFAAAKAVRREQLRQARERSADSMPENDTRWDEIRPALDELLASLKPAERDAVLLRYFEGKGYAEIGARLRIGEDAARMRVDRALERMRDRLAVRGIASTAAVLGTVLTMQAGMVAPSGLAGTVARSALAHAGATPGIALLQSLMGTKTTLGAAALLGLAGLVSIPTIGIAVHEVHAATAAQADIATAQRVREAQIRELQQLQAAAGHDAAQIAAIQRLLDQAHATATATVPGAPASAPTPAPTSATTPVRGDGAAFLAAYPQIRPLLLESGMLRTDPKLLAILAKAGMSPEQIDAFNARMWTERIDSLKATPNLALGWTVSGLPSPDELRPVIGDAGIAAVTACTKMAEVNTAAAAVAAQVALAGPPLTPPQVDELTHAMYTVKPSATLAPGSPDWNAAFGALQSQLTPEQWQVVENGVAQVGFPVLLKFLQWQPMKAAANPAANSGTTP